jgi:D-lactate dehydrogenase (cytochrome)
VTYDCTFLTELDLGGEVSFDDEAQAAHAGDWGAERYGWLHPPDAVVWPVSTADVATVLAAANERSVPVTPFAAGTSIEGHAVPSYGGISLDLTRLDEVLEVRPEDLQVDVEPGVVGEAIDEAAATHGLAFPPIPASGDTATIGGMIATDASGTKAVKYGEVGDWVLALEAVLADGTVITTGSKAAKTSSGYNLASLLVGSEGTLAVVTRATLRLTPRPAQIRGGRAVFPTLDDAVGAVTEAVQSGIDVAKLELIDEASARMANAYLDAADADVSDAGVSDGDGVSGDGDGAASVETSFPERPAVFVEFHGDRGIDAEIAACRELFERHGVDRFETAGAYRMAALWRARRDLVYAITEYDEALSMLHPGDVTVPISHLGETVRYVQRQAADLDVVAPCFGHVGDGNLHYIVMVDRDDPESVERGETLSRRVVEHAIEVGGTATGEHGVGRGKREYLVAEHGEATVEAMRAIKRAFDPNDILNPGKLFPETVDGTRLSDPATRRE